jgi:hypothetical protein
VSWLTAPGSVGGQATLDFGTASSSAQVTVSGVGSTTATSWATTQLALTATASHSVDDLIFDPITVVAHDFIAGVGFTITGTMENAPADGTYLVDWQLQ